MFASLAVGLAMVVPSHADPSVLNSMGIIGGLLGGMSVWFNNAHDTSLLSVFS